MAKLRMERTDYTLITDGVGEHEQTLASGKPFWVFFTTNVGIATWLIGVLVAGMELNFTDALFTLFVGSAIGSALPAVTAILGPRTRLSQIEASRLVLGRTGKKIPAILNWVNSIAWDCINNILSATALAALLAVFNIAAPFWLALAILVGIQLVVGFYGHHLIQDTSKFSGILLGLFFIVLGLVAIHKTGIAVPDKAATGKDICSALVLVVVYNISWVLYTADYTRYLPAKTPGPLVFFPTFAGLFLSLFVLGFFGYVTASAITDQTPGGVTTALQGLSGHFAPLVLFLVAYSSIPANALNDNSAAYCLMSAGVKVTRPTAAVFGAVIGYTLCLLASSSFVDFFENFLFLFAHWIAPWSAILLVHWYMIGKKQQITPSGVTRECLIFIGVSAASILLFSANPLYNGALVDWVGGIDIGPYIGFVAAGLIAYAAQRLWPVKYKSMKANS